MKDDRKPSPSSWWSEYRARCQLGSRVCSFVRSSVPSFARQDREENRRGSRPRYVVHASGGETQEKRREERKREDRLYVRWLSTPVIKYGASGGSQHARASTFKDGARTFSFGSLLPAPPLLFNVLLSRVQIKVANLFT